MPENIKITLVQSDIVWEDIDKNLENYTRKISNIAESTDIIVLPEMFASGFSMNPQKFAEKPGGTIFSWMKKTAAEKSAAILGSIITFEDNKYYNRLIWIQPDGQFLHYDKRHLFSFAGEDKHYTGGTSKLIVNYKGWRIRPLICYDLRFPVWSRNRNDYDLLIYVANWPQRRNHAWKSLLAARAIENQCYTIGVNRVGQDGNGIEHSGDSVFIDYNGLPISRILPFEEKVATFSISFSELNEYKSKFAFWRDADNFEIK
jgi:predicted amidohydrolase